MTLRRKIANMVEKLTGVYLIRKLPRGVDLFKDVQKYLPKLEIKNVFDVGANDGTSALLYKDRFRKASIYCFEPVSKTYTELKEKVKKEKDINCFRIALSSNGGKGKMVLEGISEMFQLSKEDNKADSKQNDNFEEVDMDTIDNFCSERKIDHINFLKIDTEGNDLKVLEGATKMLKEHKIDLIEVEAGMNPENKWHQPFEKLKGFLEDNNYYLFALYDQVHEWPSKKLHLRRTNPLFVSMSVIREHSNN